MSQNNVVISAKGATPPVNTFIFRPYYAISEHVKGPKIYGAAKCLFLSALLRMVSNCIRPCSAPHDRCNRITGLRRRPRDSKSPCPSAICKVSPGNSLSHDPNLSVLTISISSLQTLNGPFFETMGLPRTGMEKLHATRNFHEVAVR